jgi:secreted PhoX family phosphatase
MKGRDDTSANMSGNTALREILSQGVLRRQMLQGGLVAAGMALAGGPLATLLHRVAEASTARPGFQGIPVSMADQVVVPPGYTAQVLYAWGEPISDGPAFKPDASNSAAEQMLQAGMHHDGMHFFPLPLGSDNSSRGLLAINHEYTDDGLLHVGGMEPWTAEKVAKSQAAHGVSIIEVAFADGQWQVVRPSTLARRITGRTPMGFSGPAAGHALLQTAADPTGTTAMGTLNNCAHGVTPWGTYLTCEENFNGYFVNQAGEVEGVPDVDQKLRLLKGQSRYGITKTGFGYRWHEYDQRFDAARHPHEPNRFGWVVEIDPFDTQSQPVKHTALGRFKHEGAWVTLAPDNHVVVYMGDDERNEYIYKFVSEGVYVPENRAANLRLLERGTLYVARFAADGTGTWLALVQGQHGLDAAAGFPSQAEVVINTRAAADVVGATKMDRPKWTDPSGLRYILPLRRSTAP